MDADGWGWGSLLAEQEGEICVTWACSLGIMVGLQLCSWCLYLESPLEMCLSSPQCVTATGCPGSASLTGTSCRRRGTGTAASTARATRRVPAVSAARTASSAGGTGTAACPASATPRVRGWRGRGGDSGVKASVWPSALRGPGWALGPCTGPERCGRSEWDQFAPGEVIWGGVRAQCCVAAP